MQIVVGSSSSMAVRFSVSCLSCYTTPWQQPCVNPSPPSNSLQHNKLLQGGWGELVLLRQTVFPDWSKGNVFSPQCPSSNQTSWLLAKSDGLGSSKTQLCTYSWHLKKKKKKKKKRKNIQAAVASFLSDSGDVKVWNRTLAMTPLFFFFSSLCSSSTRCIFPQVTSREVTFCSQTQTLRTDSKHTHTSRCEHTSKAHCMRNSPTVVHKLYAVSVLFVLVCVWSPSD